MFEDDTTAHESATARCDFCSTVCNVDALYPVRLSGDPEQLASAHACSSCDRKIASAWEGERVSHVDIVARTMGRGFAVSTVRLPSVHIGGEYETLVTRSILDGEDNGRPDFQTEVEMQRYETRALAVLGHERLARKYTGEP